jgi:AcrR family transcriptional regulator
MTLPQPSNGRPGVDEKPVSATGRRTRYGVIPPRKSRDRMILDAAATLFFEKGYESVGVDEIGAKAEMTGPAVYRYFDGKDEILATLFDEAIDGILRATSGTFDDATEELDHRIRAHARYVLGEQKLASVWTREDRSLSKAHRRRLHRREVQYVETWIDCVRRAFPEMSAREASRAALMALGTLNAVVLWPATPLTGPGVIDDLAAFVLGGIRRIADSSGTDRA